MNKRNFLKTSSVLTGGLMIPGFWGCSGSEKMTNKLPLSNWAGNLIYGTANVDFPTSNEQVADLVKKNPQTKALGSRHSFSTIADSAHSQLSTQNMNRVVSLDKEKKTVTVQAGIKYGELAPYLQQNGFALPNLASLPHISVAGACATATHGSGIKNGNLSTSVSAIEFIAANGASVVLSRAKDGERFHGAVVNLGALGIITQLTLDIVPSFDVSQYVYMNMPMQELEYNFLKVLSAGYSVSLFTDWRNKNISEVWLKASGTHTNEFITSGNWLGARAATRDMHPVADQSAETVTPQMGVPGPWHERLPHFKMGFKPSTGKELQSEYFVPVENAFNALMALEKLHEKISPHLFISEIRAVKADELWMSPCYKRDSVAFHTTWKQEPEQVYKLLPMIEEKLAPFHPRPHWAKLFTMKPTTLWSAYEKMSDFKQLIREYDPAGKFRNDFLSRNLFNS